MRAECLDEVQCRFEGSGVVAHPLHPALVGIEPRPVEAASRLADRGHDDRGRHEIRLD